MSAKTDITNLLRVADALCRHRNLSLKTVSLRAAKQGKFLADLQAGERGITLNRRDAIFQWFSDNWPADLTWPADIPRPSPSKKEVA